MFKPTSVCFYIMSESMYFFCDYLSEFLCKQSNKMMRLMFVDNF